MNLNLPMPPKRTLVLIIVLIILVIFGILFRLLSQKPTPSITPSPSPISQLPIISPPQPINLPQISSPSAINVAIPQSQLPSVPAQLPTYTSTTTPPENWDQQLAQQLGFTVSPTVYDQLKLWNQNSQSLVVNTKTYSVSYTQALPSHLKSLDQNQLEIFTTTLINQLGFPSNLNSATPQVSYFTTGTGAETLHPSPQNQATIAKITIIPKLNQIPLLIISNSSGSTEITFNIIHNTINLNSRALYLSFNPQLDYPLIPIDQALAQLRLSPQSTTIVNLSDPSKPPLLPLSDLKVQSATITAAKLAYLLDNSQPNQLIQPVYLFSGTATTSTNSNLSITLYLPAIDPKYLLAP